MKVKVISLIYSFILLVSFCSCHAWNKIQESLDMEDAQGCKIRAELDEPTCRSGEKAIKVSDRDCGGRGYLKQESCPVCQGEKVVDKIVGTDHYRRINYLNTVRCPECCGSGYLVHQKCKGHGWVWECRSSYGLGN